MTAFNYLQNDRGTSLFENTVPKLVVQEMDKSLTELIAKIQITAYLPLFLEHEDINGILRTSEISLLQEIHNYYNSKSIEGFDWSVKIMSEDKENLSMKLKLKRLIEILIHHPDVHGFVEKFETDISFPMKEFIRHFRRFKKVAEVRMKTTPEEKKLHEVKLRTCQDNLKRNTQELEYLQTVYAEQKTKFTEFVKDINIKIARDESIIENIKNESIKHVAETVEKSEEEMRATSLKTLEKKKLLQREINLANKKVQTTREESRMQENCLREICSNVQKQYIDLLAKYDNDIGGVQNTLEKLTEENRMLKEEQENLQDRLIAQRLVYSELKEEQKNAIMKTLFEQLEYFKENRAAKIIQRTWRGYCERVLSKRKRKLRTKTKS